MKRIRKVYSPSLIKKIKQNKTKKTKKQQQQNNNLKKKNYPEKVIPSKGDTPRKWQNLKVTFLISSDLESDRTKKILTLEQCPLR